VVLVEKPEALDAVAVVVRLHPLDPPAFEWDHVLGHGLVAFDASPISVAEDEVISLSLAHVVIQEASKPQLVHIVCNYLLDLLLVWNLDG